MLRQLFVTLRRLAGQPSFSITAIGTLAIGIGATTAIFSTVSATLLRPLPYPDAEDLYRLETRLVDGRWSSGLVSQLETTAIQEGAPSVLEVVASRVQEAVLLTDEGDSHDVIRRVVSPGFFEMMGMPMAAGRGFTADEHASVTPVSTPVVVISHEIWTDVFGRDPGIVDRNIRLLTGSVHVVGVAPEGFDIPEGTELWEAFPTGESPARVFEAWLRVAPGTTPDRLRSELAAVMAGLAEEFPQTEAGRAFVVTRLVDSIVGDLSSTLLIVLGGAGLLLLLGAVNVATLLLGRGATRTKEMAIRTSVGASRASVFRQLLGESFVLVAVGTVIGVGLAWLGVRLILRYGASELPRMDTVTFDPRVLLFAVGVLIVTTLLVGLLPALRLSNPDIRGMLNENSRSTTGTRATHRLLSALVVVEIALAILLVAGGGWMVRSYEGLVDSDPGFDPTGRLVFRARLTGSYYAPTPEIIESPDGGYMLAPDQPPGSNPREYLRELAERLEADPRIESVAATYTLPLGTNWDDPWYVVLPGEPYDPNQLEGAFARWVSPDFFDAMGISVLEGRTFEEGDPQAAAVVNQTFVDEFLSDREPVGTAFVRGGPTINFNVEFPVVGVVEDVKYDALSEPAGPMFYLNAFGGRQTIVIATTLDDPTPLLPTVRSAAEAVEPSIPIEIQTMDEIVASELVRHRLGLILMSLFAVVSLVLAAVGIYGVIAHITARRVGELATRMAMGASPTRIRREVMANGWRLAGVGMVIGIGIAFVGGRIATSRLYEVQASDPIVLAVAAFAVLAVTLAAFAVPALRASRMEVVEGLSGE